MHDFNKMGCGEIKRMISPKRNASLSFVSLIKLSRECTKVADICEGKHISRFLFMYADSA